MIKFLRENFWNQSFEVLRILLGGFYAIFTYGTIGAEAFGFFSGLAAFAAYGFLFEGTQIIQGFQIDYRKTLSADLFTTTFGIILCHSLILCPLVFLLTYYGTSYSYIQCLFFSIIHAGTPLKLFFINFLIVKKKLRITILIELAAKLLALGSFCYTYFVLKYSGVEVLLLATGIEMFINIFINCIYALSKQKLGYFRKCYVLSLLKYAWPLIASTFASGFIFRSIKVTFFKYLSMEDFGRLAFVDGIMEKLKGPTSIYILQRLPEMIDGIKNNGFIPTSKKEFLHLNRFSLALCALITLGIIISQPLMSYPQFARFAEMKRILYVVAYVIILRGYAGLACQLVTAARKNHVEAIGGFISISIQFCISFCAVFFLGFPGALFALCLNTMTTGIVNYLIAFSFERKKLKEQQCAE